MIHILRLIGKTFLQFLESVGKLCMFTIYFIKISILPPFYMRKFLYELFYSAYNPLPIVGVTAIFTGMVLTLQCYTGFSGFSAEAIIPKIVLLAITHQLSPVLTGLMVTGRIGAGIAAHIGTMRVTEQIDAMETLETNSIQYLITPRIFAGILSMPFLVLISDVLGVLGGYLVAVYKMHFNPIIYLQNIYSYLTIHDIISSVIKGLIFGFLISLLACYHGFYAKEGAAGVGRATTNAVISASALILITNYILTEFLALS